jgi:hypothetical protein
MPELTKGSTVANPQVIAWAALIDGLLAGGGQAVVKAIGTKSPVPTSDF